MRLCLVLILAVPGLAAAADPPGVADALKAIRVVKKEGDGNGDAAKAWAAVVSAGADALIPTLTAFDDCTATAANWLRTAADAIAENELTAKRKLNETALTAFVTDAKRHPEAREIAFAWLGKQNPTAANDLLPKFLDDPSLVLRRSAIDKLLIQQTTRGSLPDVAVLQRLFVAARDKDQVEQIAKELTNLKVPPQIAKHFGYITEWHAIGPFDNKDGTGFAVSYPPQTAVDLTAKYPSAVGDAKIGWVYTQSDQKYGVIDLNATLGKHMDVTAYAFAEIVADADTPAELRVASQNAVKFLVNGKEVLSREEYHHGQSMDQHTVKFTLKKGRNEILLKVCQNNQKDSWAQVWGFSARLCDATGGKLPIKQRLMKDGKETITELGQLKPAAKKEGDK